MGQDHQLTILVQGGDRRDASARGGGFGVGPKGKGVKFWVDRNRLCWLAYNIRDFQKPGKEIWIVQIDAGLWGAPHTVLATRRKRLGFEGEKPGGVSLWGDAMVWRVGFLG